MLQCRIQDLSDGGANTWGVRQLIITARKRSLGQGNIFRSVCQEFCPPGGGSTWAGTPPSRYTPRTRYPPGRYPPGTRCTPRAGTPPGNKRAVCILLECIIVWQSVCRLLHKNFKKGLRGGVSSLAPPTFFY